MSLPDRLAARALELIDVPSESRNESDLAALVLDVLRDVGARDDRGARRRRQEAGDHLHRRRFAGAVRAEKAQNLAFRDREGHAIDRRQRAEFFDEMANLQHTSLRRRRPALPIITAAAPRPSSARRST
jgi:hypothetical protein